MLAARRCCVGSPPKWGGPCTRRPAPVRPVLSRVRTVCQAAVSTSQRTHYDLLGVTSSASTRDIKHAFRKLALQYHPDHNKTASAVQVFAELVTAYNALLDPSARQFYDNKLFVERQYGRGAHGAQDFSQHQQPPQWQQYQQQYRQQYQQYEQQHEQYQQYEQQHRQYQQPRQQQSQQKQQHQQQARAYSRPAPSGDDFEVHQPVRKPLAYSDDFEVHQTAPKASRTSPPPTHQTNGYDKYGSRPQPRGYANYEVHQTPPKASRTSTPPPHQTYGYDSYGSRPQPKVYEDLGVHQTTSNDSRTSVPGGPQYQSDGVDNPGSRTPNLYEQCVQAAQQAASWYKRTIAPLGDDFVVHQNILRH